MLSVFFRRFLSGSHCSQISRAFRSLENGPEAEIAARWRPVACLNLPSDRSTPICYWFSVDIFRPALTVLLLLALSHFDKTDRKRKSAVGDATHRK
jgi:hypothetical protein